MRRLGLIFVMATLFWVVAVPPAHAYIDAGSGSYIFQILIGSLLAVGVAIKVFWRNVRVFVGARFSRKKEAVARDR